MEQVAQEFGPQGLTILAVDIQESRETVARWIKAKGITARVVLDADGVALAAYRVTATPTVILIGRDGGLVGRGAGNRPWTSDAGRALLRALLEPAAR